MKKYAALIIDIKKSRTYNVKMRNDMQWYIMDIISTLNNIFRNSLEKEVFFSAGDEVQGLFSSVEASYLYFRLFNMLISPIEIRAGIGVGEWDVVIEGAGTTAQDGTAYHNARLAINTTKESLGYSVLLFSGKETDIIINSLFNATAVLINKQSQYQNEIMLLAELLYPITIYGMADISEYKQIIKLAQKKSEYLQYDFFNKRKKPSLFFEINVSDIKSDPINVNDEYSSFFVIDGRVRGLPVQLSELIGVSRQSVDRTIKIGNIYEARNLAIAVIKGIRRIR